MSNEKPPSEEKLPGYWKNDGYRVLRVDGVHIELDRMVFSVSATAMSANVEIDFTPREGRATFGCGGWGDTQCCRAAAEPAWIVRVPSNGGGTEPRRAYRRMTLREAVRSVDLEFPPPGWVRVGEP